MFGRNKPTDQQAAQKTTGAGSPAPTSSNSSTPSSASSSPAAKASEPSSRPNPAAAVTNALPRRVIEIPGRRAASSDSMGSMGSMSSSMAGDMRKLTVGRDITLSGEISTCDILAVEGQVEATLRDGRLIEIAENGTFRGSVEIDNADIGGCFEGDLTVHQRLTVRSTGRVTGRVRYGELEVQAGGQIMGEVQVAPPPATQTQPASYKQASSKLASFGDDTSGDDNAQGELRASA